MKKKEAAGIAIGTILKIVAAVVVIMVVYRMGSVAYDFGQRVFSEPAMDEPPGVDVTITIEEGDGAREIGKILEKNGLIRDVTLFVIQEKLSGFGEALLPGTYTLNTSQTIEEILQTIALKAEETEPESEAAEESGQETTQPQEGETE